MISRKVITEIRERLVPRFHPEKIILFGSQARRTADQRSDVDLLVVSALTGKRRRMMLEIERALGMCESDREMGPNSLSALLIRISRKHDIGHAMRDGACGEADVVRARSFAVVHPAR